MFRPGCFRQRCPLLFRFSCRLISSESENGQLNAETELTETNTGRVGVGNGTAGRYKLPSLKTLT